MSMLSTGSHAADTIIGVVITLVLFATCWLVWERCEQIEKK